MDLKNEKGNNMNFFKWFKGLFQKNKSPSNVLHILPVQMPSSYLTFIQFPQENIEGQIVIALDTNIAYRFANGKYEKLAISVPVDNYKHIQGNVFLVRNFKGFISAIDEFKKITPKIFNGTDRPPLEYPSVVFLSEYSDGRPIIKAECIPVNKMRDLLRNE
jgi:hypothetical protein